MTLTQSEPEAGTLHADVIQAITSLAAYLEIHPSLPLDANAAPPWQVSVQSGTDEENRAEIDRIASLLNVTAGYAHGRSHYEASRDFGAGVVYRAVTVSREYMDRYYAVMSYRGSVQPEADAA